MSMKHLMKTILAVVLAASGGLAQSPADQMQQAIYARDAQGQIDNSIRIFREVIAATITTNRTVAAQAQYQLVLSMLAKSDRGAAVHEFEALEKNFPDQVDLIGKALKVIPATNALLPAPWGERESLQLNISRSGTPTGGTLFYSIDPAPPNWSPDQQGTYLTWELDMGTSRRSVRMRAGST